MASLTKSAETGLSEILNIASTRLEQNNHAFVIDISQNNEVLFQIVHSVLLDIPEINQPTFNFTIYLTFSVEVEQKEKFEAIPVSGKFSHFEWQGIPCYTFNAGCDKDLVRDIAMTVLYDIYNVDQSNILEFEIHDHGPL